MRGAVKVMFQQVMFRQTRWGRGDLGWLSRLAEDQGELGVAIGIDCGGDGLLIFNLPGCRGRFRCGLDEGTWEPRASGGRVK